MRLTFANLAACVAPHKDIWPRSRKACEAQYAGVLFISEMYCVTQGLMEGGTKADLARELWNSARFPIDRFKTLVLTDEGGAPAPPNEFIKSLIAEPEVIKKGVPVAAGPDRFLVVVTGGH
jgi:hypothetical protein